MVKRRGAPSQGWRTFLRNHAPDIAAMDLFVVPTIGFNLLYAFVVVRLDRRDLLPCPAPGPRQSYGTKHLRGGDGILWKQRSLCRPGGHPTGSASRSRMQASIWSRSDLVMQNIVKCAHRLSTTRNLLFGISFCSASQSAGGKNMSRENGTT